MDYEPRERNRETAPQRGPQPPQASFDGFLRNALVTGIFVATAFMLFMPKEQIPAPQGSAPPVLAPSSPSRSPERLARGGEELISSARLKEEVFYLAHDRFKGRGTGEGHLEGPITEHIETTWRSAGVAPFGDDGTYRQAFKVGRWQDEASMIRNGYRRERHRTQMNEKGLAFDKEGKVSSLVEVKNLHKLQQERLPTHNLVGIVEGSDPALRDEYIVVGAHLDHIGAEENSRRRDGIYNGADDNASGSAAVIEIARALGEAKRRGQGPKRSVIIILFSGEELGLLGSQYWVKKAPIPLSKIKGMVNLDMIGRLATDQLSLLYGEKNQALRKHQDASGLGFKIEIESGGLLEGSDHYSFYTQGIPIVALFEGYDGGEMNPDYHGRGDHADKVNYTKLHNATRLAYRFVVKAANS